MLIALEGDSRPPLRVNPALVETDLVVTVTAAQSADLRAQHSDVIELPFEFRFFRARFVTDITPPTADITPPASPGRRPSSSWR